MPRRDGSSGHFSVFLSREGIGTTAQSVGSVGDAFSAICCLQIFRFTSSKPSKSAIASDKKCIRHRTNSFVRYCPCNPPPASFAQHIGQGAAVYTEVTTPSIIRASGEGDFLQKAPFLAISSLLLLHDFPRWRVSSCLYPVGNYGKIKHPSWGEFVEWSDF